MHPLLRRKIKLIEVNAECRHLKNLPVKGLCGRFLSVINWFLAYIQSCWYFQPSFVICTDLPKSSFCRSIFRLRNFPLPSMSFIFLSPTLPKLGRKYQYERTQESGHLQSVIMPLNPPIAGKTFKTHQFLDCNLYCIFSLPWPDRRQCSRWTREDDPGRQTAELQDRASTCHRKKNILMTEILRTLLHRIINILNTKISWQLHYNVLCEGYVLNKYSNISGTAHQPFSRKKTTSVADPGCLSRIRIFPSRIQGQKDSRSQIRTRLKEFKYF